MNVYEPSTPRAAVAVVAVAMAVFTIAALVVLPAELEAAAAERSQIEAANAAPGNIGPSPCIAAAASAHPEAVGRMDMGASGKPFANGGGLAPLKRCASSG